MKNKEQLQISVTPYGEAVTVNYNLDKIIFDLDEQIELVSSPSPTTISATAKGCEIYGSPLTLNCPSCNAAA